MSDVRSGDTNEHGPVSEQSSRPDGEKARRDWPLDRLDVLLAVAVAIALYVLYRVTFQERQFGDSPLLTQIFAAQRDGRGQWVHVGYMPVAGALYRWFDWDSPVAVLRFLSSAAGALGCAFTYVLCRSWSAPRATALCASLLLGVSPGYWFFSSSIEVHALHAACVGLCACLALLAPWGRPVLAAMSVAIVLPIVFLSHQSGLMLGPGFVMLAQYARTKSGHPPFRVPTLLFAVGPLFLTSFLVAIALATRMADLPIERFLGNSNDLIDTFNVGFALTHVYAGWLQPLGAILPLVVLAIVTRRLRGLALATTVVMVLPSMIFFLTWGLPERGGYTFGTAGFLCAAAATMLPVRPRRALVVGGLLIALQGTLAYRDLKAFDEPWWGEQLERRAVAVSRVIPDRGTLVSINPRYQYIEAALPDVAELSLWVPLCRSFGPGRGPKDFTALIAPQIEEVMAKPGNVVVLDMSYRSFIEPRSPEMVPYLDAFEEWLAQHYQLTRFEDEEWPMALLR